MTQRTLWLATWLVFFAGPVLAVDLVGVPIGSVSGDVLVQGSCVPGFFHAPIPVIPQGSTGRVLVGLCGLLEFTVAESRMLVACPSCPADTLVQINARFDFEAPATPGTVPIVFSSPTPSSGAFGVTLLGALGGDYTRGGGITGDLPQAVFVMAGDSVSTENGFLNWTAPATTGPAVAFELLTPAVAGSNQLRGRQQ